MDDSLERITTYEKWALSRSAGLILRYSDSNYTFGILAVCPFMNSGQRFGWSPAFKEFIRLAEVVFSAQFIIFQ